MDTLEITVSEEESARRVPQSTCYESSCPGVRFFHQSRLKAIMHLISLIVKGKHEYVKLVDIGCGDGFILRQVYLNFVTPNLVGIDISKTRLERAKKLCPNACLIRADAQSLPLRTVSCDVVVCSEVIEHIPDDKLLLQEIRRIINRNGFLILTTPNLYTLDRIFLKILTGKEIKVTIPDHLREYNWQFLLTKIRAAGLHVASFKTIGFYVPFMEVFFRSEKLTRFLFFFSRLLPLYGRIFILLCRPNR